MISDYSSTFSLYISCKSSIDFVAVLSKRLRIAICFSSSYSSSSCIILPFPLPPLPLPIPSPLLLLPSLLSSFLKAVSYFIDILVLMF